MYILSIFLATVTNFVQNLHTAMLHMLQFDYLYLVQVYLPCLQVPQGDSKYGGSRKEVQGRVVILLHSIVNAVIIFVSYLDVYHSLRVNYTLKLEIRLYRVIKRS